MPEDKLSLTPEQIAELKNVEEAMKSEPVAQAAGLLLATWRLYWLVRAQMIAVSDGKITEKTFPIASQALSRAACEGFKIGKLKNQMKRIVLPFLKDLSSKEVRTEINHDKRSDSACPGGDESPANA